jgi:hypothetical protein
MDRLERLLTRLGRRLGLVEKGPREVERDWLNAMRRLGSTGDAPAQHGAPAYIPLIVGSQVRRLPRQR